ncbi:uncharacterized protein [Narcine bancroftii]|uniref:uncharacterized protein isoform X2 n=1 Tax=Narcine bancroftii TaxID=1343680 RepID=UPI0038316DCA
MENKRTIRELVATEELIRTKAQLNVRSDEVESLSVQGISYEKIVSLGDALLNFKNLKSLDLARNCIVNLRGLESLHSLEKLNLYFNNVQTVKDIAPLRHLINLQELDLRLNPINFDQANYRLHVIHLLPNLKKLDDKQICDIEWESAEIYFQNQNRASEKYRKEESDHERSKSDAASDIEPDDFGNDQSPAQSSLRSFGKNVYSRSKDGNRVSFSDKIQASCEDEKYHKGSINSEYGHSSECCKKERNPLDCSDTYGKKNISGNIETNTISTRDYHRPPYTDTKTYQSTLESPSSYARHQTDKETIEMNRDRLFKLDSDGFRNDQSPAQSFLRSFGKNIYSRSKDGNGVSFSDKIQASCEDEKYHKGSINSEYGHSSECCKKERNRLDCSDTYVKKNISANIETNTISTRDYHGPLYTDAKTYQSTLESPSSYIRHKTDKETIEMNRDRLFKLDSATSVSCQGNMPPQGSPDDNFFLSDDFGNDQSPVQSSLRSFEKNVYSRSKDGNRVSFSDKIQASCEDEKYHKGSINSEYGHSSECCKKERNPLDCSDTYGKKNISANIETNTISTRDYHKPPYTDAKTYQSNLESPSSYARHQTDNETIEMNRDRLFKLDSDDFGNDQSPAQSSLRSFGKNVYSRSKDGNRVSFSDKIQASCEDEKYHKGSVNSEYGHSSVCCKERNPLDCSDTYGKKNISGNIETNTISTRDYHKPPYTDAKTYQSNLESPSSYARHQTDNETIEMNRDRLFKLDSDGFRNDQSPAQSSLRSFGKNVYSRSKDGNEVSFSDKIQASCEDEKYHKGSINSEYGHSSECCKKERNPLDCSDTYVKKNISANIETNTISTRDYHRPPYTDVKTYQSNLEFPSSYARHQTDKETIEMNRERLFKLDSDDFGNDQSPAQSSLRSFGKNVYSRSKDGNGVSFSDKIQASCEDEKYNRGSINSEYGHSSECCKKERNPLDCSDSYGKKIISANIETNTISTHDYRRPPYTDAKTSQSTLESPISYVRHQADKETNEMNRERLFKMDSECCKKERNPLVCSDTSGKKNISANIETDTITSRDYHRSPYIDAKTYQSTLESPSSYVRHQTDKETIEMNRDRLFKLDSVSKTSSTYGSNRRIHVDDSASSDKARVPSSGLMPHDGTLSSDHIVDRQNLISPTNSIASLYSVGSRRGFTDHMNIGHAANRIPERHLMTANMEKYEAKLVPKKTSSSLMHMQPSYERKAKLDKLVEVDETGDCRPRSPVEENSVISAKITPFLENFLDLVDRYWNGTRSLHTNQRFINSARELLSKGLNSMSILKINNLEKTNKILADENSSLLLKATSAQDNTELYHLKHQLIQKQNDLEYFNGRFTKLMEENNKLRFQLARLEEANCAGSQLQNKEQQKEIDKLNVEVERLNQHNTRNSPKLHESHRTVISTITSL